MFVIPLSCHIAELDSLFLGFVLDKRTGIGVRACVPHGAVDRIKEPGTNALICSYNASEVVLLFLVCGGR